MTRKNSLTCASPLLNSSMKRRAASRGFSTTFRRSIAYRSGGLDIPLSPKLESFPSAFQQIYDLLFAIIYAAYFLDKTALAVGIEDNHSFRLSQDRNVGVMCNKDHLT